MLRVAKRASFVLSGLLLVMALGITACSKDGDSAQDAAGSKKRATGSYTSLKGSIQQLWILEKVVAVDSKGGEEDITADLVSFASQDMADAHPVSGSSSFSASHSMGAVLVDSDGFGVRDAIVDSGVFEADDSTKLAFLVTPKNDSWLLGQGNTVLFDIPTSLGIDAGSPLVMDYTYAQYLPIAGAEGRGAEPNSLDLLSKRAAAGAVAFEPDGDGNSVVLMGDVGMTYALFADEADDTANAASNRAAGSEGGDEQAAGFGSHAVTVATSDEAGPRVVLASEPIDLFGEDDKSNKSNKKDSGKKNSNKKGSENKNKGVIDLWNDAGEVSDKAQSIHNTANDVIDLWNDPKGKGSQLLGEEMKKSGRKKGARTISDSAGLPDGAEGIIEGLGGAAEEALKGCFSAACVDKVLGNIKEGAGESLKHIGDQLDFEGLDSPPGSPQPPGSPDGPLNPPGEPPGPTDRPNPPGPIDPPNPPGGLPTPPGTVPESTTIPPGSTTTTPTTTPPTTTPPPTTTCKGCDKKPKCEKNCDGKSTHDPHMTTFDQVTYDMMVNGEFTLARSQGLEVQVRYEPAPCGCLENMGTVMAISDGTTTIQVSRSSWDLVIVDGEVLDITKVPQFRAGGFLITRITMGLEIMDSLENVVSIVNGHRLGFINAIVRPGVADTGWEGLLGNADGNPDNDFKTRDGKDLGANPGEEAIASEFAESWRVTDATSLFSYLPGRSSAYYANLPYPMPAPDDVEPETDADRQARAPRAKKVCGMVISDKLLREICERDFTSTGLISTIRGTRLLQTAQSRVGEWSVPRDDTPVYSKSAAADGTVIPSAELQIHGADLPTGSGLVLLPVEVKSEAGKQHKIVAVDTATRSTRWEVSDISTSCPPAVVDGVGVAVWLEPGQRGLPERNRGIAVLSFSDGSLLFTIDHPNLASNCGTLHTAGNRLVVNHRSFTSVFELSAEGSTFLWDMERGLPGEVAPLDEVIVAAAREVGRGTLYEAYDIRNGAVLSSAQIDGVSQSMIRPLGNTRMAVEMEGSGGRQIPEVLAVLEYGSEKLTTKWTRTSDEKLRFFTSGGARAAGDVLVAWVADGDQEMLKGFDLATGKERWTNDSTGAGFPNYYLEATPRGILTRSHGHWAMVLDPANGKVTRDIKESPRANFDTPFVFNAVADGTVMLIGNTVKGDDGAYQLYTYFLDLN